MSQSRAIAVSQQKRFSVPSEKIDLDYVLENWNKTHTYGVSIVTPPAELRVYCRKCDEELSLYRSRDFVCFKTWDVWGNHEYGCGFIWAIDTMRPKEVAEALYTVPFVDTSNPVYVIDEGTDGLKRYSYSRKATEVELVNYHRKALKWKREKLAKK